MPITTATITFRPHRLGFLITVSILLGVGLACLDLGLNHHPLWLVGTGMVVLWGGRLANSYSTGALALRGAELVVYQGNFVIREITVPVWSTQVVIEQHPFGRVCDAGMVIVTINDKPIRVRVAQLRAFRTLLSERKLQVLALLQPQSAPLRTTPVWTHAELLMDGYRERVR